ncbi:hypothetical protein AB6A40_002022 [Gnathostoma spinigerum]|uniref:carbonyl reductase (NADPH) n=1 Tax=Gnathostoma spinigerum TaxID=75299 RepID=A0ABD6EEL7_9BILA
MAGIRIFVVTGANKGIGYGIVKGLGEQASNAVIYLTARDETRGKNALHQISEELGNKKKAEIRFQQLDVTDKDSIRRLATFLKKEHDGLDVLVNNAGFAYKTNATESAEVQARDTIAVNYEGVKNVCDALIPIMRNGGRIVNVCSQMGLLDGIYKQEIINTLTKSDLTVSEIDQFCQNYIRACEKGNRREQGYPESAYRVSKAAAVALTMVLHRQLKDRHIVVNACCPGYVNTDMTSHKGSLTIEEGADTPVYLATLESDEPNGQFIYLRKPIDWATHRLKLIMCTKKP